MKPREWPLVQGASEAFLIVARSPVASFALALVGVGLAVVTFFASPLAGAIVLAALLVSFSTLGDTYGAAGKQNIVISLRETKKRGDEETYVITRRMRDMFPAESEWVATEIALPTQLMAITVRFPADRPPSGAWLRSSSDPDHKRSTLRVEGSPDGRQRIEVRVTKPKLRETYTVWWDW